MITKFSVLSVSGAFSSGFGLCRPPSGNSSGKTQHLMLFWIVFFPYSWKDDGIDNNLLCCSILWKQKKHEVREMTWQHRPVLIFSVVSSQPCPHSEVNWSSTHSKLNASGRLTWTELILSWILTLDSPIWPMTECVFHCILAVRQVAKLTTLRK